MSVCKYIEKLHKNNSLLASTFSSGPFHRPLIDLLSTEQMYRSDSGNLERAQGRRPRTSSGDMNAQVVEPFKYSMADIDDEKRYLFHDIKNLSSFRPAVLSRNRKLQHKVILYEYLSLDFCLIPIIS